MVKDCSEFGELQQFSKLFLPIFTISITSPKQINFTSPKFFCQTFPTVLIRQTFLPPKFLLYSIILHYIYVLYGTYVGINTILFLVTMLICQVTFMTQPAKYTSFPHSSNNTIQRVIFKTVLLLILLKSIAPMEIKLFQN